MLKIKIDARATCKKHPRYDPAKGGVAAIVGNCATCLEVFAIFEACREFEKRTAAAIEPAARACLAGRYISPEILPEQPKRIIAAARFRYDERVL